MMDSKSRVSRRKWLGAASAASLSGGLLEAQSASAGGTPLGARVYNIVDFGAKGDGKTLDTKALQAAIDACNKDRGGTVLVPEGTFVIGTVEMKSNVTLHIAAQGTLWAAPTARSIMRRTQFRCAAMRPSTTEMWA